MRALLRAAQQVSPAVRHAAPSPAAGAPSTSPRAPPPHCPVPRPSRAEPVEAQPQAPVPPLASAELPQGSLTMAVTAARLLSWAVWHPRGAHASLWPLGPLCRWRPGAVPSCQDPVCFSPSSFVARTRLRVQALGPVWFGCEAASRLELGSGRLVWRPVLSVCPASARARSPGSVGSCCTGGPVPWEAAAWAVSKPRFQEGGCSLDGRLARAPLPGGDRWFEGLAALGCGPCAGTLKKPRATSSRAWGAEVSACQPPARVSSRKAEGKAASTELPPEYLTSPLSQQSQVLPGPAGGAWPPGPRSGRPVPPSCPPRGMRRPCRRRRSCSWPWPCRSRRPRRRRGR